MELADRFSCMTVSYELLESFCEASRNGCAPIVQYRRGLVGDETADFRGQRGGRVQREDRAG